MMWSRVCDTPLLSPRWYAYQTWMEVKLLYEPSMSNERVILDTTKWPKDLLVVGFCRAMAALALQREAAVVIIEPVILTANHEVYKSLFHSLNQAQHAAMIEIGEAGRMIIYASVVADKEVLVGLVLPGGDHGQPAPTSSSHAPPPSNPATAPAVPLHG